MAGAVTFVLGGARSGKTRHGLSICEALHTEGGVTPVYVATAQALSNGDHTVTVRITDRAGNVASESPAFTVNIGG